jgi:hypothetical protein
MDQLLADAIKGKPVKIPFCQLFGNENDVYPVFWSQQQFQQWLNTYNLTYTVDEDNNYNIAPITT